MQLNIIKIQKMFGLFDYNIELNRDEKLTILTGPNGYGKTTILNIIYNLFNQRFFYFQKLNFELISFSFDQNKRIDITKKKNEEKTEQAFQLINNQRRIINQNIETTDIHLNLYIDNTLTDTFIYNSELENKLAQELQESYPVRQLAPDLWINDRTGKQIKTTEFLDKNSNLLPECLMALIRRQGGSINTQILQILSEINVYLIKEQRLLKPVVEIRNLKPNTSFINTIEKYAEDLKNIIVKKQLEAYKIIQQLDSSFPKRLIECKEVLSESDFKSRFADLTRKQELLRTFGIATTIQDVTEYNTDTANVLTVYLEDSEKKISVYDELLSKIELFVNILNEKRFAFKSIMINGAQGFYFQSSNEQRLNLADLSSGEQQEVVLQYELLFKTNPNTLILIDEPEISLHVMWQKALIQDLQRIAKMKHISFLISTHAPQIINDRWDLTRDLYELSNVK
ncbi:MAG: AAA family ATPase [Tannerellaceae bacterium]|jgi:predicted ATP-binding protein involved in virulence|nr:AAA family ATPase [Tannerellaceae bacterium]